MVIPNDGLSFPAGYKSSKYSNDVFHKVSSWIQYVWVFRPRMSRALWQILDGKVWKTFSVKMEVESF